MEESLGGIKEIWKVEEGDNLMRRGGKKLNSAWDKTH